MKDLSVKYRPVRIGFLVRDGSIEDLVTAAGLNTLLYGGVYNPVLPVSADDRFAEKLLKAFNVDVLYKVCDDPAVDAFAEKHPRSHNPFFISTNFFYEGWEGERNCIMYLDSLNPVHFYWEREYKHKGQGFVSEHLLVTWDDSHPLRDLFSICFGYFPKGYNLRDDFEGWYLKGMRADTLKLEEEAPVGPALAAGNYQLLFTGAELKTPRLSPRTGGVCLYVGDESDFRDLLLYWNLRATGKVIEFLPLRHAPKFEDFVREHLKKADREPQPGPVIDYLDAYCQRAKKEEVEGLLAGLDFGRRLIAHPCDDEYMWDGFTLPPVNPYFGEEQTLATVTRTYDGYSVAFSLPENAIIKSQPREIERQSLIASIDPLKEGYEYPRHTLKPPYIRELNSFYGVTMMTNSFRVKSEEKGIRVVIEPKDYALTLSPVFHQTLIERIFALAGIKAELSQPGVLANQIIRKLGSVDGGRVFKITGVRDLMDSLATDDSITRSQATRVIHEANFDKFEELYIESRRAEKLTPDQVFDFLLRKEFFRAGLELLCDTCHLKSWLTLREVDDYWVCDYCGGRNQTSLHLRNRGDWKFRKSGLFAKGNNQEGAIPVILTLLQLHRQLEHFGYAYSPALKLKVGSKECETDLCVLQSNYGHRIEIGIAECKSRGGVIERVDVENLMLVRDKLKQIGLTCALIFAKTADAFTPGELELFRGLAEEHVDFILFTRRELEPYYPYGDYEKTQLVDRHPTSLESMGWNSRKIYLGKV